MPNYAPYVIVLFDSILLSIISQQLWFRYRVYRKYSHIELVREQVVHKRKDIYRVVICMLLVIKTTHSFFWLLYQGWDDYNFSHIIKPWFFWAFYGILLSISVLLKGDFASVVVAIEQNIAKNGRKKAFWRGVLMGTAVLSAILTMWGIVLSINIRRAPVWQYLGFATSLLNGFITYKMLTSIISTTRETQESTYHVRPSITAKEFEKQLFTLFHMKQMAVALAFIGLYAIYEFIVNIYYMVQKDKILQPFIGNASWYLYSKLIIFNFYLYSMAMVFLMYTWISYAGIREAAIKAQRVGAATTPDNPENDIVILPDTLEIAYARTIDPNDPDNQYRDPNETDTEVGGDHYGYGRSRRNSDCNPLTQVKFNLPQETVETVNVSLDPEEMIPTGGGSADNSPVDPRYPPPNSPASKLSVLSNSNVVDAEAEQKHDTVDVIPLFGHKISIRHRAQSSVATDINVEGFIQESHKDRPHTTMFDMNILAMQRKGCSLERIYFDTQRYRGITPKSLKLTRRMRSISYSQNNSRNHSRRNTMNTAATYTAPVIPKKEFEMTHSQSVPNVLVHKPPSEEYSATDSQMVAMLTDADGGVTDTENSQQRTVAIHHGLNVNCNIHSSANITVPEDAVLTPSKESGDSLEIKMKEPQQKTENDSFVVIIAEENENENSKSKSDAIGDGDAGSNGSNSSITTNGSDVYDMTQMPQALAFSKVKIYSNSAHE